MIFMNYTFPKGCYWRALPFRLPRYLYSGTYAIHATEANFWLSFVSGESGCILTFILMVLSAYVNYSVMAVRACGEVTMIFLLATCL